MTDIVVYNRHKIDRSRHGESNLTLREEVMDLRERVRQLEEMVRQSTTLAARSAYLSVPTEEGIDGPSDFLDKG